MPVRLGLCLGVARAQRVFQTDALQVRATCNVAGARPKGNKLAGHMGAVTS